MIGIVLIDDHAIFRDGLVARLKLEPDFAVMAEAATYHQALDAVAEHRPDIAVTDLSLRGTRGGLDLIAACISRGDRTRFLALSMHEEDVYAERVINLGGAGYLTKQATGDEVVDAIRVVHGGRIFLSQAATSAILGRRRPGNSTGQLSQVSVLSNRELEVFTAIGNRLSTKQIAGNLNIAAKTVETHKLRIRKKLGLADSHQLFVHAYEHVRAEAT